jgi:zinc protease
MKENPRFNGLIPTEKSWEQTDYELAYKNTKSVLPMPEILNFF